MRTIWKLPLDFAARQSITVPQGSKFLMLREQFGVPTLWFACEPGNLNRNVDVIMVGTGHECPPADVTDYLGSIFQGDGVLVWHFFVEKFYA